MKPRKNYLLLVFAVILFASCANTNEQKTINGNWEVKSIKGQSDFQRTPNFIINLEASKIAGFAGCNQFFGTIKIEKNNITLNQLGSTRMMCPDMTTEDLFLKTLSDIKSFSFNKTNLEFLSESNDVLMVLKTKEEL